MKRIALTLAFFIAAVCAFAQNKIIVQGTYPDLYIIHKTIAKESLTSISKLYNLAATPVVKVSDISENGMVAAGKEVKIPINKSNFTQDGQQGEGETLIALYHIVQKNENLFRISQVFGKVRIDFLREWNDLNNDVIQLGQKIIIGHMKVPKDKAAAINSAASSATDDSNGDNGYEVKEEKKTEPKKEPETKKAEPAPATSNDDNDEGFFVTQYPSDIKGKQQQIKTGEAATFKTTSGWSDKKYYVLMNDIVPGTIVRITGSNNKSVCAKVLGALPDMKENTKLLVRMSNATASALHITDPQFQVQVSYFK